MPLEDEMSKGRPSVVGKNKVSLRVLFSQEDYDELERIAELERTDISTLVRRAVARYFFISDNNHTVQHQQ
jgi:hypothetical protein